MTVATVPLNTVTVKYHPGPAGRLRSRHCPPPGDLDRRVDALSIVSLRNSRRARHPSSIVPRASRFHRVLFVTRESAN